LPAITSSPFGSDNRWMCGSLMLAQISPYGETLHIPQTLYETLKTLYESGTLKEKHLKMLVGLNVDKSTYGIMRQPESKEFTVKTGLKRGYLDSLGLSAKEKETIQILEDRKEIASSDVQKI